MMHHFITSIEQEFQKHSDADIALHQAAYMRNQFDFYGIPAPLRHQIQAPFLLKAKLPKQCQVGDIVKLMWEKEQREYKYCALDLCGRYIKQLELTDIATYEFMVTHKSWWDTVDIIATKLMGAYFKIYPQQRQKYVAKWLLSGNIWLQRSALLFQLKYKEELDTQLLADTINALLGSNEFFINKAIGWILRRYATVNEAWVLEFVNTTSLHPLSKREALRLIKKKG